MRHEAIPLNVKATSTGAGTALRCDRYRDKTVQLVDPGGPAFTGAVTIEGSLDGSSWSPLISGIVGAGVFTITSSVVWLRANVTARAAGTLTGIFAGFDSRTDGG